MSGGLGTRVLAWIKREVPAGDLEAYRAAGPAHDLLLHADRRHTELLLDGHDRWSAPPAAQAELLATWCATALQALGDAFLESAYDVDPSPAGHVPELIRAQALAFYQRVEVWVVRARKAGADPGYRLRAGLPDALPDRVEQPTCPPEHLHAMVTATRALRARAAVACAELLRAVPDEHGVRADRLGRLQAGTDAVTDTALALLSGHALSVTLRRRVEERLWEALEGYYRLGQLAARPSLLDREEPPATTPAPGPRRRRGKRRRR